MEVGIDVKSSRSEPESIAVFYATLRRDAMEEKVQSWALFLGS